MKPAHQSTPEIDGIWTAVDLVAQFLSAARDPRARRALSRIERRLRDRLFAAARTVVNA